MKAAKKSNDPRLSALAVRARLDAFSEVKKTITDMINKLLKEKDDDVKHKDYCIDEFNTNEVDTANKDREKELVIAAIQDLQQTIENLSNAIETLKAEVQELEINQKRASANRDKANKEFQAVVADQQATQKLLTAALNVLKSFYDKAALVQQHAAKGASKQPPPPGFKTYEKSAASGGVMGMIQKIIDDAKAMEADAVRSEEEGQAAFEQFTKDTTESLAQKNKDIVMKSAKKAQTEKDLVNAEASRDQVLSELESLDQVNADLHKSCDFLMKNFEMRKSARTDELEGLAQAKAILSGSK
jgi:cell division septum initiation protein DivIVA